MSRHKLFLMHAYIHKEAGGSAIKAQARHMCVERVSCASRARKQPDPLRNSRCLYAGGSIEISQFRIRPL